MIVVRARWVVPVTDRPILNGWVAIDRGRIAAVGRPGGGLPLHGDAPLVDLGAFAILPALVNAHAHLELSWMAGLVPPARSFIGWVSAMLDRRVSGTPAPDVVRGAIVRAIEDMHRSGTGLVGDVSNTLASVAPLRESALAGVVFHEVLGFRGEAADGVLEEALRAQDREGTSGRFPVSLAPHAPYSVSPRLFQGIRHAGARTPFLPSAVHVAESPEEVELLGTGGGPWRPFLERLGAWDDGWVAPRCRPVEYLDRMRVLGPRLLAVHGVQCDDRELALLRERGSTLVTCPRSNVHVGVGAPPARRMYRAGVRIAIGTDSLASNADPNLFSELAALRRLAPDVPAGQLVASATIEGARALGFDGEAGALEPGRSAALIAVAVPARCADVEEELVQGIAPDRVRWVSEMLAESGADVRTERRPRSERP